jgi:nicotinamidase-related amidase
MTSAFRHGPLSRHTSHLCVDMQNLFRPGAPWATPWFERVLPNVVALVRANPAATVFSRFVPPARASDMPGLWKKFYERWEEVTRERIDPALIELAPELAQFVPPATVIDKAVYSPFHGTGLARLLGEREITTLVISGTETDVCVVAAALDAVDFGYRVVIARDAVCSSSDATHDAMMKLYHERFSEQIEVADVAQIIEAWNVGEA